MLEFEAASGHVFYLNTLIIFIAVVGAMGYLMTKFVSKQWDKILHLGVSILLAAVGCWICETIGWYWWIGAMAAWLVGLGKEIADKLNKKKKLFDKEDLLADSIGVAIILIWNIFS